MSSSINEDGLSAVNSSQFDDLSSPEHGRLDAELEALDQSSATSRKRPYKKKCTEIWSYSRKPKGVERGKDQWKHQIWYCGQIVGHGNRTRPCPYSSTNMKRIREHLTKNRLITLGNDDSEPLAKRQATLLRGFDIQKTHPSSQFTTVEKQLLRRVLDKEGIAEKLIRLLASNNQSLRSVEWKEFIEFSNTLNPFASEILPDRRQAKETLVSIHRKYKRRVMRRLRNSLSKIHFSVDIWSSPTRTNLQAICCHFLDEKTRKVTKACLALANHPEQYRAEEQTDAFLRVIKEYNISHNRIGAFISDNHGSNDKMIRILQEPWTEAKNARCLTKTHPAYDTYSPVDSWDGNDTRPRVMTYIRKDSRILADQKRPTVTRDILWVTVNGVTIVNFYRQPHHDVSLDVLLRWPAPERTLVAGDFNAKHYSWQTGRLEGRGEDIATWAAENSLNLLNTADVPTNPHGNTIDLAFSNIALASAVVEDHLATSSDHFTLSLILPDVSLSLPQVPGKVRVTTEEELKRFKELIAAGACRIPMDTATASQLDTLAAALVDLLQSAARAAGRPVRKGTRSAPWWTDECAEAAAEYRAIRRILPLGFSQEVQLARREFQRVVRRAKRQYWRNLIDGFSDSASVYKAVRWLKSPGAFQPPPLQIGDDVYEAQLDKANALRRSTLERRTAADDITNPWIPVRPVRKIPFAQEITLEEAEDATIKTGNTSPGADNITVKLLQAVWDIIGGHVCRLYQGCLTVGHHPGVFREAEVVMIPKPGKRNLSTPRAWRPISLLFCLGKGLERLIARRLAWASIHYAVLHPQQAGALPKRSAVDLVAALIHDIEEAFARGEVATLVTADIQGAFDTAMCNRLVLRLREQGWPDNLARWAGSFMSGRSARVRYQDITTPTTPLQCGLPQGSPVSPILFLLYTEPIYRLGNPEGRFGYADDTAILCTGQSLEETSRIASEYLQELVNWGAANGISFDPEKTEVMHFSLRRRETELPVRHGDVEKQPEAAMRWLGLWLDRKLTFKTHVEKWTAKAQAIAHHLQSLGNTRRGALPSAVQRAVRACVEPILLFGVEAWYPGTTSPRWRQPTKEGPSRIQQLVRKMSKALKQAIRAILPTWKTTPIAVLHRESGIPPLHQLLEARRLRFSARIKSLDHAHPLAKRITEAAPRPIIKCIKLKYQLPPKTFPTRLRRTNRLLGNCQRPVLIPRKYSHETQQPLQTASKEESAKDFDRWLQTIPPLSLIVYSDGSLSPSGAAGYGYAVHQNRRSVCQGAGRLGPAEVFDAEAKGALEGLKAALRLPQSATQRIVVCLDNIAAAACLRGKPSGSSQRVFLTFQALAKTHRKTEVRWIPGHTKIPGNEQADILAKTGCAQPEPADAVPTLAFLRKTARQRSKTVAQAWWDASAPDKYQSLTLKFPSSCPPELALPRTMLHHLLAARTHHAQRRVCYMFLRSAQGADASLLLPEDSAALSDETRTLTDRGDQPSTRQRFRQIRQAGEGKLFLREDLPAPLDDILYHSTPVLPFLCFFLLRRRQAEGGLNTFCLCTPLPAATAARTIDQSGPKLDEYYNRLDETPIYYTSLALHPAYRWGYFETVWSGRPEWISRAKDMVQLVWDSGYKTLDISVEERGEPATKRRRTQYYSPFEQFKDEARIRPCEERDSDEAEDEYTRWQKDLLPTDGDVRDPQAYWHAQRFKYPRLSRMALDFMTVQAMSAECERLFSAAGRMITPLRNQLEASTIAICQVLRSWLQAGIVDEVDPILLDKADEAVLEQVVEEGMGEWLKDLQMQTRKEEAGWE
ncbi:reverse transcriptase domain protein [Metarhizium robertsii]|uniref:Reverse transcriptase domain protein n=1 Tax=Metarhizium robertsii TaxID=568076 RepID=A0A014QRQ8_9HYPO|nr:reverse transcriptase domain protein [Metarhizium robertsii]